MPCGGGVAEGLAVLLETSLTRFEVGGGSSLSKDMMLDVFRGSGGRLGGAAGPEAACTGGVTP